MKILYILLFVTISLNVNAQELYALQGRVIDDGRGRGVPDVYVALMNSNRGLVTNARGVFSFKLTNDELASDLFFSCAGYYDTIIPCKRIIDSEGIIKLRVRKVEVENVDVFATFDDELCYGDTTYMFTRTEGNGVPYYTEYGHSVGVIIRNKNFGLLDRIYVRITDDEYYGGKFALRFKRVYNQNGYLPWQSLNRYHDIIPKTIVVEAESPGVISLDISLFKGFVSKKYDILVLIYPLEEMQDMVGYSEKKYAIRERSDGSANIAVENYAPLFPKNVHTVFLFNDTYIVAKAMPVPQIALVMKTLKKRSKRD